MGLSKPLVRGSISSSALSADTSSPNFPDGQDQYTTKGGLRLLRSNTPLVSISTEYEPRPGSIMLFFEMNLRLKPVTLFRPTLAPGSPTSVGSSKLCHNGASSDKVSGMRARFPLFMRTALVVLFVLLKTTPVVDQIMDSVLALLLKMMTRLPSLEILSCACLRSWSVMGFSLLAIQTVVKTGILLNHMPRYQPGEEEVVVVVVLGDLLVVPGLCWNWKKPSANLPFLDMSLSPAARASPAARVSPFAVAAKLVVCKEEKRRSPPSNMYRGDMAGEKLEK